MTVPKRVAELLDMAVPETEPENENDVIGEIVPVEPHEVISVVNPDLPNMSDIDYKLVEGEKQLEELIVRGMKAFKDSFEQVENIEPKFRGRFLEVVTTLYVATLEAVKHKNTLQIDKSNMRLKQAGFAKKTARNDQSGGTTNVFFTGTIDELKKMVNEG